MLRSDSPFVSVIVPAKNEAAILGDCLCALFSVDHPRSKFEVIVIDNGSIDSTARIAKDKGAKVYIKPELTISALRNYGAKHAQGDVIAFVDADVLVRKDWLTSALPILFEDGVGCVGCSPEIPAKAGWVEKIWHLQVDTRSVRYEKEWLESMNMLVRKQAFTETGGFNETLRTCEDVDFCYRLTKRWKIIYAKNIAAVHYGEAKSVAQLFKKESWRGISNFDGVKSHGMTFKELPSHAIALYYCFILLVMPLLLVFDYRILCIVACTSLLPPGVIAVRIANRARSYKSLLSLMILWTVYCFARGWSLVRRMVKSYDRQQY